MCQSERHRAHGLGGLPAMLPVVLLPPRRLHAVHGVIPSMSREPDHNRSFSLCNPLSNTSAKFVFQRVGDTDQPIMSASLTRGKRFATKYSAWREARSSGSEYRRRELGWSLLGRPTKCRPAGATPFALFRGPSCRVRAWRDGLAVSFERRRLGVAFRFLRWFFG